MDSLAAAGLTLRTLTTLRKMVAAAAGEGEPGPCRVDRAAPVVVVAALLAQETRALAASAAAAAARFLLAEVKAALAS